MRHPGAARLIGGSARQRRHPHQLGAVAAVRLRLALLHAGRGVDEDPVTGAAHCCLVPHWAGRLGKREFVAYQASARGGVVRVRLEGDRVLLGGQAVTVLRGELAEG